MIESFSKIAPYLSDPFILIGFFLLLALLYVRLLVKDGIILPVAKSTGGQLLKLFLHYGFLVGLLVISLAFFYKYRELELSHAAGARSLAPPDEPLDIAGKIVVQTREFSTTYTAQHPLTGRTEPVKVSIRYPQIAGHPARSVERRLNDLLARWAGINDDHQNEHFDHAADFEVVSLESNVLAISLVDGGVFLGAGTGATISKTIVLNLLNGERFELKDVFRSGYHEHLLQIVRSQAFCDLEKTRPADDPGAIRDDQPFFIKRGDLVLVYQRREICSGADGPTLVTIDGRMLRPLLNPNGPLGYLI